MRPNEETVLLNNEATNTTPAGNGKNESWKVVSIGAATGILVGAGGMYAANAYAAGNKQEEIENVQNTQDTQEGTLKLADTHDDLSFGDAFAAARAEVGPGGVFNWQGNLYSTYTKEEWDLMTDEQKDLFAEQVKPEIKAADVEVAQHETHVHHTATTAQAETAHAQNEEEDVTMADEHIDYEQAPKMRSDYAEQTSEAETSDDDDVQLVNSGQYTNEDGTVGNYAHVRVENEDVLLVDVDGDGYPDIAAADLNHDGELNYGEVIDIQSGDPIAAATTEDGADVYNTGDDNYTDDSVSMTDDIDTVSF